jgi:hypothetical protein
MRRPRGLALAAALAVLFAFVATGPSRAAAPASGTVNADTPVVQWSGGPFAAINPVWETDCPVEALPFCDSFALTVEALPADRPDVLVSVAADSTLDILTLSIYRDGTKVAESTALGSSQTVALHTPEPGLYSVRAELQLGTPGTSTYRGVALAGVAGEDVDLTQGCTAEETALALAPDDGRVVDLDVLVLLDGVDQGFAEHFFADVAQPYADIDVRVVPTFQSVDPAEFTGDSSPDLINQTRARFPGGKVPAEYDVVELLTNRDIQALGQYGVAGQADCLGGLAYDERSFEVSEGAAPIPNEGVALGPVTLDAKLAAKITAHEMAHLLGGQHHYANCVEGIEPDQELNGDTSPCTLLFNAADFVSLKFDTLNGKIARGYALKYASANDAPAPPVALPGA